jgi:hypothetical protein
VVRETSHAALPAHAPLSVNISSKLVRNEGHFTLDVETVFPYLPWDCSGVTEYYDMLLSAHGLQAVQARLKSVTNEGHFTLDAEMVFGPHLPLDCSGVTE